MSAKAKVKEVVIGRNTVRLTPWRRFFLVLWTFAIFVLTWRLFARMGPRMLVAALIIVPIIFGVLVGYRLLGKFDRLMGAISGEEEAPATSADRKSVLEFLRSFQSQGQFRPQDLENWCQKRKLPFSKLLELSLAEGWVRFMGNSLVITSSGEQASGARKA